MFYRIPRLRNENMSYRRWHARLFYVLPIIVLLWGAGPGLSSHAQNLPSWAEPSERAEESRFSGSRESRGRRATGSSSGRRASSSKYDKDALGPQLGTGGEFRTNATVCSPSECGGGCPEGETCVSPGGGGFPNNCQCKSDDNRQVQQAVPLSPVGAFLLVFSGLTYGAIKLRRRGEIGFSGQSP